MGPLLYLVFLLLEGARQGSSLDEREITCNLERNPGKGNESLVRFWYDPVYRTCKQFVYQGQGGNKNNFEDETSCNSFCKDIVPKLCWEPPYEGRPVRGVEPVLRWFYNKSTDTCEEFYFKGLDGRFNKFDKIQKCEDMCQVHNDKRPLISSVPVEVITKPIILTTSTINSTESSAAATETPSTTNAPTTLPSDTTSSIPELTTTNPVTTTLASTTIVTTPAAPETTTSDGGVKFPFVKHCLEYPKDGTYCELRPHIGYYYHAQKNGGDCRPFEFYGCDSTYNHYETHKECQEVCVNHENKSHEDHLYDFPYTYRSYCLSPIDYGKHCFKNQWPQEVTRYHYNEKTGKCETFQYLGCGGYPNKYSSEYECLAACSDKSKYPEESEVGLGETWPNYIKYRFPE